MTSTFWERVEYALQKAAEDARNLDLPMEQEVIIWQETDHRIVKDNLYYFITLKAAWITQTRICLLRDERNYG